MMALGVACRKLRVGKVMLIVARARKAGRVRKAEEQMMHRKRRRRASKTN